MKYQNIREETLKNKVAKDFFDNFDCTEVIRDIDFAVALPLPPPLSPPPPLTPPKEGDFPLSEGLEGRQFPSFGGARGGDLKFSVCRIRKNPKIFIYNF